MNIQNTLTAEQITGMLRISRNTLTRWVKGNRIPCHKIGRVMYFDKEEIDKWWEKKMVAAPAP